MKKKLFFCITLMMLLCYLPMSAFSASSAFQQRGAQVVSPDPSLTVKVLKAYRSGEYVIVDMLFCNVSSKDFKVNIALQRNEVSVYDELGNQYTKGIYGKFTKDGSLSELPRTLLPSEIPVRFSLYIKDVEEGVTFLPKIIFECRTGYSPAKLSIKNVRILEQ